MTSHSRETIKLWLGTLAEVFVPWARRDLDAGDDSGRLITIKRWILYARSTRARASGDARALQKILFLFWRADTADTYFDRYLDRYQKWFLGPHHEIVDQISKLARSGDYSRLIEVGCGAGRVLEHCAAAVPEVQNFIGVDINPVIIARDKTDFAQNPRLQFVAADASVWLRDTAQPGTILLTYGGVMEYFSSETLLGMFKTMAQYHPAVVALVEPVDPAHDLANDPASHVFGQENSFSHNYEKLLQAAGYRMLFRKYLRLGGVSWVMLVTATE